jgi:hypothetical protein
MEHITVQVGVFENMIKNDITKADGGDIIVFVYA